MKMLHIMWVNRNFLFGKACLCIVSRFDEFLNTLLSVLTLPFYQAMILQKTERESPCDLSRG